jgi:predicted dehydrogenase
MTSSAPNAGLPSSGPSASRPASPPPAVAPGSPGGFSRRDFVKTATAATAGAASALALPTFVPASARGADGTPPPSERIRLGIIGCGGMGLANLGACAARPEVVVTAACDVNAARRDAVVKRHGSSCKGFADFRELLAHPDLDAVIIATPPHWHALMAIAACEAGKDLYLQKPMTLHLAESLAVRNAVRKHRRVCQIGTQIHAGANYRRVVEYLRSGNLGPVAAVRTFNVMNQGVQGVGHAPDEAPPAGVDWDMWCGPAPLIEFNRILADNSYNHCSWLAYSGGWTPGMAPHIIDLPIWALDLGFPTVTSAAGGRFVVRDDGDAYDHHEVLWQYPGVTLTWMSSLTNSFGFEFHGDPQPRRRLGISFHGVHGTLWTDYGGFKIVPEGDALKGKPTPPPSIPPSPGHEQEWLECIRTRNQPSCCADYHVKVDVPIVLSLLSLKLGRSIRFDPATESIVGDPEAARLAVPEYRAPWRFPRQYLV